MTFGDENRIAYVDLALFGKLVNGDVRDIFSIEYISHLGALY